MEKTLSELKDQVNDVHLYPISAKAEQIPADFKEWRVWRNLSLRDVELLTGISNGYLSQLETGKVKSPAFDKVVKLCRAYNVRLTVS